MPCRIDCILFDLDGTLIDSRADLAAALDRALVDHGLPAVGVERVSRFVGDGALVLVERAIESTGSSFDLRDAVLATFLERYRETHLDRTVLYPGVAETLDWLVEHHIRCAVVSNKPHEFTWSLLEHLGIAASFQAVIGGDSLPVRKPRPEPLLAAVEACASTPERAAIVGDGEADMRAARAAGLYAVGATYGFRDAETLRRAGADALIGHIEELPGLLSAEG